MENYIIHRDTELYHFGVKGQKWGIRRYQNLDGSYKSGAEGRYYNAESSKISGTKKNVSTTGGGMSVAKTTKTTEKIKGYSLMRSSSNSKTPDREKSGGGGGAVEDKKKEEETNNPNATAPYEKTLSDGTKITVYPTSMKKAQTGKGSGSSSGSSNSAKKEQEEKEKEKDFKLSQFTDKIDNLFGNMEDADWEDMELDSSDIDEIDDLITKYRKWREGNKSKTSKTKKIDSFIERYQAWRSNNKMGHTAMGGRYLQHFGILGMKWGIRRYQNPDGSYTAEGKRRKSKGKNYSEDYWNAHDKKKVEYMSDKELQKRNNRLQQEQQYKQLTKSSAQKAAEQLGKRFVDKVIISAAIGAAAVYVKKNSPEIINAGKKFAEEMLSKRKNFAGWMAGV